MFNSEFLVSSFLFGQVALDTVDNVTATWPNPYPKQLAATWNAPDSVDQPLAYVQDHIFDSAYGVNTSSDTYEPSYFGHDDMTELYSRSQSAFMTPPPNNYTATVIGPDGKAFADYSAAVSMYAYENFQSVSSTCDLADPGEQFNAFYWVFANAANANTSSFNNVTFAANVYESLVAKLPIGVIYNASIHTPVPGLDSRTYFGGFNNPTLNTVFKFWLCNDNEAITAFRRAQVALIAENDRLGITLEHSFVIFTRPFVVYDRKNQIGFDTDRATNALLNDRFRGDVAGPPISS
ncbi:hypothetical protein H2203_003800 [Taxawa tesnikishii (nom. ined.)]|nr:hypothetical protein H2203_003800 [Dothideales sp. JES 119]